jgi:dUTP pyrophosphatase
MFGPGRRFLVGPTGGSALDRQSIVNLVQGTPPLVEAYLSLDEQLQPSGFDLTLRGVGRLVSAGFLGQAPDQRELSATEPLVLVEGEWVDLAPGPYLITFNEIVNLPRDLMALGRPRSSLLRCGVSLHTAVWDAGYRGRSQALLVVFNELGYRVQRGARLMQLVFFRLAWEVGEGYQGRFLGENL